MHLKIDSAKCEGFGPCADAAPTLFQLDEWGYAELLVSGPLPAESVDDAQKAVDACPVHAIKLLED